MQETMAVWKFRVRRHGLVNFWSTYLDVYFFAAAAGRGEMDLG